MLNASVESLGDRFHESRVTLESAGVGVLLACSTTSSDLKMAKNIACTACMFFFGCCSCVVLVVLEDCPSAVLSRVEKLKVMCIHQLHVRMHFVFLVQTICQAGNASGTLEARARAGEHVSRRFAAPETHLGETRLDGAKLSCRIVRKRPPSRSKVQNFLQQPHLATAGLSIGLIMRFFRLWALAGPT